MKTEIKFIVNAVKWFDKVNGNTYHSVRIARCSDGEQIYGEFTYGYGNHYRQTALEVMAKNGWLPEKYKSSKMTDDTNIYMYERENNYPISWNVRDGLKRECIVNGKE